MMLPMTSADTLSGTVSVPNTTHSGAHSVSLLHVSRDAVKTPELDVTIPPCRTHCIDARFLPFGSWNLKQKNTFAPFSLFQCKCAAYMDNWAKTLLQDTCSKCKTVQDLLPLTTCERSCPKATCGKASALRTCRAMTDFAKGKE